MEHRTKTGCPELTKNPKRNNKKSLLGGDTHHTFNSNTLEAQAGLCEFKDSLVYGVHFRTARATQWVRPGRLG